MARVGHGITMGATMDVAKLKWRSYHEQNVPINHRGLLGSKADLEFRRLNNKFAVYLRANVAK